MWFIAKFISLLSIQIICHPNLISPCSPPITRCPSKHRILSNRPYRIYRHHGTYPTWMFQNIDSAMLSPTPDRPWFASFSGHFFFHFTSYRTIAPHYSLICSTLQVKSRLPYEAFFHSAVDLICRPNVIQSQDLGNLTLPPRGIAGVRWKQR